MRYRNHQRLRELKLIRQLRRRKRFVKKRNILHNTSRRILDTEVVVKANKRKHSQVIVPRVFSFADDKEGLLKFINKTYKECKNWKHGHLYFNMDVVQIIDTTAICILLSLINKLTRRHITSSGTYPLDKHAKELMLNSGFVDVMNSSSVRLKNATFPNQMYMIGNKNLNPEVLGASIKKAVGYITGTEHHFNPIYSIMVEICSNSVEHANDENNDKNWLISITYSEGKAFFTLTDSGQGILKTLHKKASDMFLDIVSFKSDSKVLMDVFDKKYQSKTQEINRHKGLPKVKQAYIDGYISELEVLTNNILYDFDNNLTVTQTNEFRGTLFRWRIDINNYKLWQKKRHCA